MKLITDGITRIVVLTPKYAIKFPRLNYGYRNFITGIYSNLSEADCWRNNCFDGQESFTLCPVKFSFAGLILIMPRVKVCKTEDEIKSIPLDEPDRKPDNYGHYMGRIVCIDYPYHRIYPFK